MPGHLYTANQCRTQFHYATLLGERTDYDAQLRADVTLSLHAAPDYQPTLWEQVDDRLVLGRTYPVAGRKRWQYFFPHRFDESVMSVWQGFDDGEGAAYYELTAGYRHEIRQAVDGLHAYIQQQAASGRQVIAEFELDLTENSGQELALSVL